MEGLKAERGRKLGFGLVLAGVALFFLFQYGVALWRLGSSSGAMMNKFSALAQDDYLDFLIWQNVYVLIAYAILTLLFSVVLLPLLTGIWVRFGVETIRWRMLLALVCGGLTHGYFVLRLVQTRPYFLDDAKFGHWYYEVLNVVPDFAKPAVFVGLFTILPVLVILYAIWWYWRNLPARRRGVEVVVVCVLLAVVAWRLGWLTGTGVGVAGDGDASRPNVIIIGSDSLRGDRLGYMGYEPRRRDGLAAAGVSPRIDELAAKSVNLANCFTPIASTLESGTSLMSSMYPHTHGLRQMYPNEETVREAKAVIEPLAGVLRKQGYDTAAFGDWCAGYYELMPMDFERASVSTFDNFKVYMSQAVVMAHFVIPLYFDHPAGYLVFPQLGSFAQFVTPKVVTERVERRLVKMAREKKPFFWHVFYSCNHLPYRNPEPYASMFTETDYIGLNRNGVDFDIDSFIGGTDLEDKWKALPEKEVRQIRNLYDGCTRQFDDQVGVLLDAIKANGLEDNTIVIITSDHGDNLYEEGVTLGHGLTFNGGLQANHVPLLFHIPGAGVRRIDENVRTLDIAPTVADLLGVEKPTSWEGRSVAGWLRGTEAPASRAFYGETGFPFIQFRVEGIERPKLPPMDQMTRIDEAFNYQFVIKDQYKEPLVRAKQRCLATEKWKMICTPTAQGGRHFDLFKRTRDVDSADVPTINLAVKEVMKRALVKWIDEKVETPLEGIFPDGE